MTVSHDPARLRTHHDHVVAFYGAGSGELAENVGRFITEGLRTGEAAVVIATPAHRDAFYREITDAGLDLQLSIKEQRIRFLDVHETLARLTIDNYPDDAKFFAVIGGTIDRASEGGRAVRAYGEMVGELWQEQKYAASAKLEMLWSELQLSKPFKLFCGYPIDVFGGDFSMSQIDPVLRTHQTLVSGERKQRLAQALNRAMDEVLGDRADWLRPVIKANHPADWGTMPPAESLILWLRNYLPGHATEILKRAKAHYGAET